MSVSVCVVVVCQSSSLIRCSPLLFYVFNFVFVLTFSSFVRLLKEGFGSLRLASRMSLLQFIFFSKWIGVVIVCVLCFRCFSFSSVSSSSFFFFLLWFHSLCVCSCRSAATHISLLTHSHTLIFNATTSRSCCCCCFCLS